MPGAIYRAEFLVIEDKNRDPHTDLADPEKGLEDQDKKKSTEDIIGKKDKEKKTLNISAKTAVGTAIAVGTFIYNTSVNEQLTSYSIQGDSIAARNLQNQKTMTNELTSVGTTLLAGAMVGGPAGLAIAGGALAVKYAMKAIDYGNQIQIYNANIQKDQYLSSLEQDKIQLNAREFR
jgi:hypothetical protein